MFKVLASFAVGAALAGSAAAAASAEDDLTWHEKIGCAWKGAKSLWTAKQTLSAGQFVLKACTSEEVELSARCPEAAEDFASLLTSAGSDIEHWLWGCRQWSLCGEGDLRVVEQLGPMARSFAAVAAHPRAGTKLGQFTELSLAEKAVKLFKDASHALEALAACSNTTAPASEPCVTTTVDAALDLVSVALKATRLARAKQYLDSDAPLIDNQQEKQPLTLFELVQEAHPLILHTPTFSAPTRVLQLLEASAALVGGVQECVGTDGACAAAAAELLGDLADETVAWTYQKDCLKHLSLEACAFGTPAVIAAMKIPFKLPGVLSTCHPSARV